MEELGLIPNWVLYVFGGITGSLIIALAVFLLRKIQFSTDSWQCCESPRLEVITEERGTVVRTCYNCGETTTIDTYMPLYKAIYKGVEQGFWRGLLFSYRI